MDQSPLNHVKGIIEALLFVNEKPVSLQQMKDVLDGIETAEIRGVVEILKKECTDRESGVSIVEIAGGYQMLSNSLYAEYVRRFYKTKHKEKLSKPALETLASVAYKQPITRGEVELIRGVNSDGVILHLLNKELIKTIGRKDVPGRPYLYGTTKQFMEYFGLKSLEDLPKLEDFPRMAEAVEQRQEALMTQSGEKAGMPQAENTAAAAADAPGQEAAPEGISSEEQAVTPEGQADESR